MHRLDLQTSGILFFAKNALAAQEFAAAIKDGQVQKVYLARVYGKVEEGGKETGGKFSIDHPIGRMKGPLAKFSIKA